MSSVGVDLQKQKPSKRKPSAEHVEQVLLFKWLKEMAQVDRRFTMAFALTNAGKRTYAMANWYKSEGLCKGVPDIFLAVPKPECPNCAKFVLAGLFIEMKAPGKQTIKAGGLAPEQEKWIGDLRWQGYQVNVCYSAEEAKKVILDYLGVALV